MIEFNEDFAKVFLALYGGCWSEGHDHRSRKWDQDKFAETEAHILDEIRAKFPDLADEFNYLWS